MTDTRPPLDLDDHVKKAWEFYKKIGSPQHVAAPMVDQSELGFRMMNRKYNTHLCYTPMMHARIMTEDKTYKAKHFWTCPEDRPLFSQLCGNEPEIMLKAGQMVEDQSDAIDCNFGCPQGIAKKGHYGAYLLHYPDLVCNIIRTLHDGLKIPVTAKIRVLPTEEETVELAKRIEASGAYILTVHGRTKEQKQNMTGKCDWDIIRKIRQTIRIPMFANGGIYTFQDVQKSLEVTQCQGIMSSEALLENPALFSNKIVDVDDMAIEYIEFSKKYNQHCKWLMPHLFKMLYAGLNVHTDLRDEMSKAKGYDECLEIVLKLKERRKDIKPEDKFGWYWRHVHKITPDGIQKRSIVVNQKLEENQLTEHESINKKICVQE